MLGISESLQLVILKFGISLLPICWEFLGRNHHHDLTSRFTMRALLWYFLYYILDVEKSRKAHNKL